MNYKNTKKQCFFLFFTFFFWKKNDDERSLQGTFEEEPAPILETRSGSIRRIPAGQRPQAYIESYEALVPPSKSQHSGDEVAEPKPGPQPNRAPVGDFEAPSQWKEI